MPLSLDLIVGILNFSSVHGMVKNWISFPWAITEHLWTKLREFKTVKAKPLFDPFCVAQVLISCVEKFSFQTAKY